MRVKVLRQFRDKYTNDLHKKGKELEVSQKRYEQINSTSFGILVKVIEDLNLDNMTKKELVDYAKEQGIEIDKKMTKKEIIKELI